MNAPPLCLVCQEDIDQAIHLECGHAVACDNCLIQWFTSELTSRKLPLGCMMCKYPVSRDVLESILPNDLFLKYDQLEAEQLAEREWVMFYCPNCRAVMSADNNENKHIVCLDCKKHFCLQCKVEWHKKSTCEQYQQWARENGNADALTWDLVNRLDVKQCPRCKHWIEKNEGCNHMTCSQCRYEFHWSDLTPFHGYRLPSRFADGNGSRDHPAAAIPRPRLTARAPTVYLGPSQTFGQASAAILKFRHDRQVDRQAEARYLALLQGNREILDEKMPDIPEEKVPEDQELPIFSEVDLRLLTSKQLQEICIRYKISKNGNKEVLIGRILKEQERREPE